MWQHSRQLGHKHTDYSIDLPRFCCVVEKYFVVIILIICEFRWFILQFRREDLDNIVPT